MYVLGQELPAPVREPLDPVVLKSRIRAAAKPGGVDALAKQSGEERIQIIGGGIIAALKLGMRKEAVAIARQATPAERQVIRTHENTPKAAKEAGVSMNAVLSVLAEADRPPSKAVNYILIGAAVVAVLVPVGYFAFRR